MHLIGNWLSVGLRLDPREKDNRYYFAGSKCLQSLVVQHVVASSLGLVYMRQAETKYICDSLTHRAYVTVLSRYRSVKR